MTSTPLIHWSGAPLRKVSPFRADAIRPFPLCKPNGLWFSVGDGEDGWRAWCEGEHFRVERLKWRNEIVLRGDAKLLHLRGASMLDAFTAEYGVGAEHGISGIEWVRVAERYQGITIAPYCWQRRLELMWYYSWDCASGCIWDIAAIDKILPTKTPKTQNLAAQSASNPEA